MKKFIFSSSPLRVSFFGGGTDVIDWFRDNHGYTLSTTIGYNSNILYKVNYDILDKNFIFSANKIFKTNNYRLLNNPILKTIIKKYDMNFCNIYFDTDLPTRSGLASSSSFCCALLKAVHKHLKIKKTKKELALEMIDIERNILREKGGWQDQIVIAHEGMIFTEYHKNDFNVKKIHLLRSVKDSINQNFCLLWTGVKRFSSNVQLTLIKNIENKNNNQNLGDLANIAKDSYKLFTKSEVDIYLMSKMLKESQRIKILSNPKVLNKKMESICNFIETCGVESYKVLGAGSGGFILAKINKDDTILIDKINKKFKLYNLNI